MKTKLIILVVMCLIAVVLSIFSTNTYADTTCISYDDGAWITCTNSDGKQETIYITEN